MNALAVAARDLTVDRTAQTPRCAHLSISDAGLIAYALAPAHVKAFEVEPPQCPDCHEYLIATENVSGALRGSAADIVVLTEMPHVDDD